MKFNNQSSLALLVAFFAFSTIGNAQIKQTHAEQLSLDGISLSAKIYLQGALMGVPDGETLMRDDLRTKGYLPVQEPYSAHLAFAHLAPGGGEVVTDPSVFEVEGENAIVDWLFIELRNPSDLNQVLHTRSALLQRDGDIVDVNGVSPVFFEGAAQGEYYLRVRHRNHLHTITTGAVSFGSSTVSIDFTDPDFELLCENNFLEFNGLQAVWAGDVNNDGRSIWQGPGTDVFSIFVSVLTAAGNGSGSANFVRQGYSEGDINMDGVTTYAGPGNDKMLMGIYVHWALLNSTTSPNSGGCF